MPANNLQGFNLAAFGDPRLVEGFVAPPGYATSDTAEILPLYFNAQKGSITIDPQSWTAGDGSNLTWGNNVTINYPIWSSDLAIIANLKKLGYKRRVNFFAKTEGGQFLNFVPVSNGDFKTTPDGSTDLTIAGTKWSNSEKERKIDLVMQGYMGKAQADFLGSSMDAYLVTPAPQVTGGTTLSLTAITSDRASRVLEPGWYSLEWDPGSTGTFYNAGEPTSCEVSLEFTVGVGDGSLQRNQKVVTAQKYDVKFKTEQWNKIQYRAANEMGFLDGTLRLTSYAGEVLKFVHARGNAKQVFGHNDSANMEISFTGEVSLAACDYTNPLQPVFTLNHL